MSTKNWSIGMAALLISQSILALSVRAANFPDVPENYVYRAEIVTLADAGIVKGNPDGSFKPEKTINRAELLTLLYRAKNKTPGTPSKACFKDVGSDAWFSAVICDASKNAYVGGYPDGNFKPEKEVNRVEALKMIHTVFGLDLTATLDAAGVTYTDVSVTAWYAPYVAGGFTHHILPIAGQQGSKFYPDMPLRRGEAAAYIFNALGLTAASTSSAASVASSESPRRSSAASSPSTQTTTPTVDVDFPFGDDGTFKEKQAKVYRFKLQKSVTATIDVTVDPGTSVTCRLYKLAKETSFSLEYYIGHVSENNCSLRISLGNGDYQLEIQSKVANAQYKLESKTVTGDGNDGFREASLLTKGTAKTGYLESEDHADWYFFKLGTEQKLTLNLSNDDNLRCFIYPMDDVDLYGFAVPQCNEEYSYPDGTYYIGIMRRDERGEKESFTIHFK